MNVRRLLSRVVAGINTLGFVGYLVWLSNRERRVFFDPRSVTDLLPCIAFLFVFACLARQSRGGGEAADGTPAAEAPEPSGTRKGGERSWNGARGN